VLLVPMHFLAFFEAVYRAAIRAGCRAGFAHVQKNAWMQAPGWRIRARAINRQIACRHLDGCRLYLCRHQLLPKKAERHVMRAVNGTHVCLMVTGPSVAVQRHFTLADGCWRIIFRPWGGCNEDERAAFARIPSISSLSTP